MATTYVDLPNYAGYVETIGLILVFLVAGRLYIFQVRPRSSNTSMKMLWGRDKLLSSAIATPYFSNCPYGYQVSSHP